MKKNLFFAAIAAMVITSCTTTIKTATTTELPADLLSATVADLDVSSTRISYTMTPSRGSSCRSWQCQACCYHGGFAEIRQGCRYSR